MRRRLSRRALGVPGLAFAAGALGLVGGLWWWAMFGPVAFLAAPILLVVSAAELAYAYGAWSGARWALKPLTRRAAVAVAILLLIASATAFVFMVTFQGR